MPSSSGWRMTSSVSRRNSGSSSRNSTPRWASEISPGRGVEPPPVRPGAEIVCAMNPCRCGWYGDPSGRCTCSQGAVQAYLSRISGPLLDRIDIITEVPSLHFDELRSTTVPESSAVVKQRVETARAIQRERFKGTSCRCNANMQTPELRRFCELDETGALLMQQAFESLGLTARSYDRIRRVARTIADLAGSESILPEHLSEAIQYRTHQLIQN